MCWHAGVNHGRANSADSRCVFRSELSELIRQTNPNIVAACCFFLSAPACGPEIKGLRRWGFSFGKQREGASHEARLCFFFYSLKLGTLQRISSQSYEFNDMVKIITSVQNLVDATLVHVPARIVSRFMAACLSG